MPMLQSAADFDLFPSPDKLPPIAVLMSPTPAQVRPQLNAAQLQLLAICRGSISELPVFGGPVALRQALDIGWRAAVSLAVSLPASRDRAEQFPATAPTQTYFRTRVAAVDAEVAFADAVAVICRCLEDLRFAPVSGSDLVKEVAAMAQVLGDAAEPAAYPAPGSVQVSAWNHEEAAEVSIEHRWRWRWIAAHQLHALFSTRAASAVSAAVQKVEAGDPASAAGLLKSAVIFVEALAAARAHAAALPAEFYCAVLRRTMREPSIPTPLSGMMHPESRMYRRELKRLLVALPDGDAQTYRRQPDMAEARERLLNADLLDAERHICLVEAVVGTATSIVQPDQGNDNAVSILRKMRHARALAYQPFVRYGDNLGPL